MTSDISNRCTIIPTQIRTFLNLTKPGSSVSGAFAVQYLNIFYTLYMLMIITLHESRVYLYLVHRSVSTHRVVVGGWKVTRVCHVTNMGHVTGVNKRGVVRITVNSVYCFGVARSALVESTSARARVHVYCHVNLRVGTSRSMVQLLAYNGIVQYEYNLHHLIL